MQPNEIDLLDFDHYAAGPPHELWERLRRVAPVYWQEESDGGPGFWSVLKHEDITHVSKNPQLFSSNQGTNIMDATPEILPILQGIMINMDPPQHTEYRTLINKGFTPRRVAKLEGFVGKVAGRIIDEVAPRGECDFVEDVAALLPITMICELFGIPEPDRRHCYELANRLIGRDDPDITPDPNEGDPLADTFGYATKLRREKLENPSEDLATVLVRGQLEGKPVDDMIFGTYVVMMIVAGTETTRTVTTNGMLRLIQHPEQRRELVDDPSLIPQAIEEMLRFDPAVHHFRRTATLDTEIREVPIRAGQKLVLWYGSGNRDDEVFDDPHRFDIHRANAKDHLAFGIGQHFCLGATLARLQLRSIFGEVLRRIPDMELESEPRRLRSNFINGVKEMRVQFRPSA